MQIGKLQDRFFTASHQMDSQRIDGLVFKASTKIRRIHRELIWLWSV